VKTREKVFKARKQKTSTEKDEIVMGLFAGKKQERIIRIKQLFDKDKRLLPPLFLNSDPPRYGMPTLRINPESLTASGYLHGWR
jgi:hypothetical protein